MPVAIRPMTPADLDPAVAAVLDGGWGDRRTWYEFALAHPACDPLVAVDDRDGAIVGMGTGTRNGSTGWVGTIFVVPSRRREGIGLRVSAAVCERLEAAGCRTLLLVATDAGRSVYERLGFEEDGWYRMLEADGTAEGIVGAGGDAGAQPAHAGEGIGGGQDVGGGQGVGREPIVGWEGILGARDGAGDGVGMVRPFAPGDVEAATALDRQATGEDRAHLLMAFASVPRSLALRRPDGTLGGFVMRAPWGGGATIARSAGDAERLLTARRAGVGPGHAVRAGILESNAEGLDRLRELGWVELARIIRMRRGPALDWRPEMIWGQFNFALG